MAIQIDEDITCTEEFLLLWLIDSSPARCAHDLHDQVVAFIRSAALCKRSRPIYDALPPGERLSCAFSLATRVREAFTRRIPLGSGRSRLVVQTSCLAGCPCGRGPGLPGSGPVVVYVDPA